MNHALVAHFIDMHGLSFLEWIGVLFIHWVYFNMILFILACLATPLWKHRSGTGVAEP
jgi:hypothetical protein